MEIEEPLNIKAQHQSKTFGEANTFTQIIHHFRNKTHEFQERVYGYLSLDIVIANSKINRPTLFVSDVGDDTSQNDNSNVAVMTRGIEIVFATPLNYEDDYFKIDIGNRGENLQNHFLEFKYRILQVFATFRPQLHNRAVVSIANFKYQGSRFIGIDGGVAYYTYNFTYQEKLNMKLFKVSDDIIDEICWSICMPVEECEPDIISAQDCECTPDVTCLPCEEQVKLKKLALDEFEDDNLIENNEPLNDDEPSTEKVIENE